MSFSRHKEIYRSDVRLGKAGSDSCSSSLPVSSAAMSFQSAIPWQVALQQSLASASPTANDSQQPTLWHNNFSANGKCVIPKLSHFRGSPQQSVAFVGRRRLR